MGLQRGYFSSKPFTNSGDLVGILANQQGTGKGASYQAKGGKYYIQVNAIGNWSINIVQINKSANNLEPNLISKTPQSEIATFSGSGIQITRPFSANGTWEIQWQSIGDIFQLYLYTSNGELVGVPANQQGSGKGTSYQPKPGSYYLQVNAIGSWNIHIVKVK